MPDAGQATKIIVGLFVAGIMAAFLLPVAIGAIGGPEELTATQDVGETIELQGNLTATLTDANTTPDPSEATYAVEAGGTNNTGNTIAVDANQTVTVDGTDVTINVSEVNSGNATATYEYPTTYGWGAGASSLWGILPLLLVLAVFLYVTGRALQEGL